MPDFLTGQRDLCDIVREHEESEGNSAWERAMTAKTNPVDVFKLARMLEDVSDYAEVVVSLNGQEFVIVEAHRGPKTNLHPHGTFILSVR